MIKSVKRVREIVENGGVITYSPRFGKYFINSMNLNDYVNDDIKASVAEKVISLLSLNSRDKKEKVNACQAGNMSNFTLIEYSLGE